MNQRSLFWPLTLIATGVVWLMVSMNVIPAANLWALTYIWPYVLILLGLGLILRSYLPAAGWIVSALIVIGAVAAVVFAPRLGWAGGPSMAFGPDFGGGVPGSGKIESETREVQGFLAVSINYPAEVLIQQGKVESVKIEADDNLLSQLTTEVNDDTLVIENKEERWSERVNPTERVKITITVKDLHEIEFSSAGNLRVEGLKTDELSLKLNGVGEMILNDLDVRKLECRLSGAGNIEANGVADELDIRISGVGGFDAPKLESMVANVRISGAGSATVFVKDDLTARVSGAGSINYYGSPTLHEEVSGAGSVSQVDE
ncbi:MAG: DUF2807 domain-containing protein [Anaerolineae bacterium]|nr:DUF2807 domain-containing protein [Anaerolineae bacterium]MCI0609993.1 DUF2807 domain-containing protein [Anaerolineae bacterium]